MATFAKLKDGSWGVRSEVELTSGSSVTVKKRDGSRSTATVGRLVWAGDGAWLYALSGRAGHSGARQQCAECGRHSASGRDAPDASGCVAWVCSRCASLSRFERSYQ
jgi:hypothetical protein